MCNNKKDFQQIKNPSKFKIDKSDKKTSNVLSMGQE